MKAALINQHGGAEVLQYGDLPDPVAEPGEVVVDIFAASVNAADWKSRSGGYGLVKFPYVLGRDFSGAVSAVGPAVDDVRSGDEVFEASNLTLRSGRTNRLRSRDGRK